MFLIYSLALAKWDLSFKKKTKLHYWHFFPFCNITFLFTEYISIKELEFDSAIVLTWSICITLYYIYGLKYLYQGWNVCNYKSQHCGQHLVATLSCLNTTVRLWWLCLSMEHYCCRMLTSVSTYIYLLKFITYTCYKTTTKVAMV